jgi:hypothetical protein
MSDQPQNLFFLLSLAPLLAACPGDDSGADGSTTTGMPDDSTGATPTTAPPPTTLPPGDSSGSSDPTLPDPTDPMTSGTTGTTTATDSTGDSSATDDTTTGVTGTPCQAYAQNLALCYYGGDPTYAMYIEMYCEAGLVEQGMAYGPACEMALEEFAVCLGALPCVEFMNIGMGSDCDDELATLQNECKLPPGACPDQDLGSTVPQMYNGDNTASGDNHVPSCAPGGEDTTVLFTAPADGTFVFDTLGTLYDTVLTLIDSCGGIELACNDDDPVSMTLQSSVSLPMTMGQTVVVVVDGYDGAIGPFTLNISQL